MQYKAVLKNALISDMKIRLVARDLKLVGKNAAQAMSILSFVPKKAAKLLLGVLNSAVSNAENLGNEDASKLIVSSLQIDRGIRLKRMEPRAKGRSSPILKRRSHVSIIVSSAYVLEKQK